MNTGGKICFRAPPDAVSRMITSPADNADREFVYLCGCAQECRGTFLTMQRCRGDEPNSQAYINHQRDQVLTHGAATFSSFFDAKVLTFDASRNLPDVLLQCAA